MCKLYTYECLCRLLCLDALVEEGDRDMDWRLSRVEFNKLIDQDYQPSNKCKSLTFAYKFNTTVVSFRVSALPVKVTV